MVYVLFAFLFILYCHLSYMFVQIIIIIDIGPQSLEKKLHMSIVVGKFLYRIKYIVR